MRGPATSRSRQSAAVVLVSQGLRRASPSAGRIDNDVTARDHAGRNPAVVRRKS